MKKLTRTLVFVVSAMALLSLAGPAGAEEKITERLELGGETLEGVLTGPDDDFYRQRDIAVLDSLITFRDNFISEMILTVEDL